MTWQAVRVGKLRLLLQISAFLLLGICLSTRAAEYRPLPPPAPAGLTTEWLIHDAARNRLIYYLPGYHAPAHAYYQWVQLRRSQPFRFTFTARPGMSLFLDNQLVFTAQEANTFSLDLCRLMPPALRAGRHLLGVWQPEGSPALASFASATSTATPALSPVKPLAALPRPAGPEGQGIYLSLLLVLGLAYGGVRVSYPAGLGRILQLQAAGSNQTHSFLLKPAFTLLNLLLLLLFALTFALLLTAIHTDLQSLPLLRQFMHVPEQAILARVLLYTAVIAGFVLGKYVYLKLLGYIFDVQALVEIQYREFLRTTLLTGLLLLPVLVLYLGFNATLPRTVSGVANTLVGVLLVSTVLRVGYTLHRRASLLNLHLFAYLCATEILPLLVLLKLLVFVY